MPEVEDPDDLYGLPPEEFTAARDGLVKKLRAAKDKERADGVRKLRRPSNIAWALNQLARKNGDLIEAVLRRGDEVKDALDRGDGAAVREAERKMRAALDAAVDAASSTLETAGHTPTDDARSRVAATLRAAVVDPDVAERVRAGTLDREVEVAGLGLEDMAVSVKRPASASTRRKQADGAGKRPANKGEEVEPEDQAERDEHRRQDEARRATRSRLAEAEKTAERLANRAQRLAGLADRAEEAAREARAEAEEAQAEATEAAEKAAVARGGAGAST